MPLYEYRVGAPYNPTRRTWPEGAQFNWRAGALELLLLFPQPSRREIEAVHVGAAEFALYVEADLLLLLYRFDNARGGGEVIPWSDAPYSWHLVPRARPDEATLPEPLGQGEETRAVLSVLLVSAEDGIVRAIRLVTLSPAFTAALWMAIRQQAARPWPGDAAYARQLQALYRRYPSTAALLPVAQSRTKGGA